MAPKRCRSSLLHRVAIHAQRVATLRRLEVMARHAAYRSRVATRRAAVPVTELVYCVAVALRCSAGEAVLLKAALGIRGEARAPAQRTAGDVAEGVQKAPHSAADFRARVAPRTRRRRALQCFGARYFAEARVATWPAMCNVRGVAPCARDLVEELRRRWPDDGVMSMSLVHDPLAPCQESQIAAGSVF